MNTKINTKTASTFFDLLNLVEGRLKELQQNFQTAYDIIKEDFGQTNNITYTRMHVTLGDLDDFIGHLEYLRDARNSADDVTISVPADLASRAGDTAELVQSALEDTASILDGLENMIVGGHVNGDDHFVLSALRLTSRALKDFSEQEAATTCHVASLIRQENGARAMAKMAKAA
jgi:hypothetical protein